MPPPTGPSAASPQDAAAPPGCAAGGGRPRPRYRDPEFAAALRAALDNHLIGREEQPGGRDEIPGLPVGTGTRLRLSLCSAQSASGGPPGRGDAAPGAGTQGSA